MSGRNNSLYLQDILDSVDAIESYTAGMTFEMFRSNRMCYSAAIREFEIIGEAVNHLDADLREKCKDIQWRDIVDFRNILIHEYFGVDFELIWNVIKDDVPQLRKAVLSLTSLSK